MECGEKRDWRLVQFSSATHRTSRLPTACVWEECVAKALNALVNGGVIPIRLEHGRNMMSIGWAAQDCQADVAHIDIQTVFAIVQQAEAIRSFFVTRDTGDIHPGLTRFLFPIGETFCVPVGYLVGYLHELDIDRKTQLEHLELFVPIYQHADIDLFPVGVHGEVLDQS